MIDCGDWPAAIGAADLVPLGGPSIPPVITRNSLLQQHGDHLVPPVVDLLDGALFVPRSLERQRGNPLERGKLLRVDAAFEGFADLFPGVGRLRSEVGLAQQESRAIVVGVEEPSRPADY